MEYQSLWRQTTWQGPWDKYGFNKSHCQVAQHYDPSLETQTSAEHSAQASDTSSVWLWPLGT